MDESTQFHTFMKYFHEQFLVTFYWSFFFCCFYCHLVLWHWPFVYSILVCIVAGCGQRPRFLLLWLNDFFIFYEILAMMLWGVWEISFLLSACRTMHIVLNVWLFYLCTVIFILGTAVFIEAYFLFPDCATAYSFQTQLTQSIFCFFSFISNFHLPFKHWLLCYL